ncbi:GrpB family protein [Halobacterium salinarum]|uniref:GrpB family protein n=1 Tax=Halobacterium TaxID=2239 RepID=UPI0019638D45|nr:MULTISPECIES: GrpB family protein [Halobacterium]MDL0138078.1 GrpB family protein [Halobacterium salinarum]QRY23374.1 GrpB family protein [Halobacterium sp. GSL-19]WJK64622.1 GrpB family protein [Halobacterium salinarum]
MVGLARDTVELEPHDSAWHDAYKREAQRLRELVGDRVLDFQHVGSTAVDGLPAKPVIDVLAVVDDDSTADDLAVVLAAHGYEHRPNDDVPDRVFLAKGPRSERTHYLSLVTRDSDCYREQIAFRDALRSSPDRREEYAELKRELAAEHADDRRAYTAAKSASIERMLALVDSD